ncbi:uncharacterized protein SCDLUD_000212 [Saccharomycodes ludwigii]|uniref:uncharacterized protein n=1 Tax=Saccharomycodes ludwigii TaxID=36035 RepID=UPI001E823E65|nr:hypothetical protein SCDLUD_000212 [Saccharomycodes ludwigii]KAH3902631.1 hypothetical protein SCDLUD_000212 [Saccharomycodes ludwigii]
MFKAISSASSICPRAALIFQANYVPLLFGIPRYYSQRTTFTNVTGTTKNYYSATSKAKSVLNDLNKKTGKAAAHAIEKAEEVTNTLKHNPGKIVDKLTGKVKEQSNELQAKGKETAEDLKKRGESKLEDLQDKGEQLKQRAKNNLN